MVELLCGICVYYWIKHQLAIYYNNQADGTNGCLRAAADTLAAPAGAMKALQPVDKPRCESIQDLSRPWCWWRSSLASRHQGSALGSCPTNHHARSDPPTPTCFLPLTHYPLWFSFNISVSDVYILERFISNIAKEAHVLTAWVTHILGYTSHTGLCNEYCMRNSYFDSACRSSHNRCSKEFAAVLVWWIPLLLSECLSPPWDMITWCDSAVRQGDGQHRISGACHHEWQTAPVIKKKPRICQACVRANLVPFPLFPQINPWVRKSVWPPHIACRGAAEGAPTNKELKRWLKPVHSPWVHVY